VEYQNTLSVAHAAIGCGQKNLEASMTVLQVLPVLLAKGHLSGESHLSANDKGDNEMIQGAVYKCQKISAQFLVSSHYHLYH
jgi:hypothetical protein